MQPAPVEYEQPNPQQQERDYARDIMEIDQLQNQEMTSDALLLSYMMKIEVPPEYREEFGKFMPLLTRRLALANIRREDVKHFKTCFSLIVDYYRISQPLEARRQIRETLCELLLTSSVGGFQVRQTNTRRSEHALEGMKSQDKAQEEKKKRRFGFFGRK